MRLRRLAAALALPLALSPALTACGGDPAAPPPLTPAPSTASSPTPTEQAETAEEFIRRWQAEADKMQTTGETEVFLALTHDCEPCDALAAAVTRIYSHGGFIHFAGTRVVWIKKHGPGVYDERIDAGRTQYKESPTSELKQMPGGRVTMRVYIDHVADGWRVTETTQLAGSAS